MMLVSCLSAGTALADPAPAETDVEVTAAEVTADEGTAAEETSWWFDPGFGPALENIDKYGNFPTPETIGHLEDYNLKIEFSGIEDAGDLPGETLELYMEKDGQFFSVMYAEEQDNYEIYTTVPAGEYTVTARVMYDPHETYTIIDNTQTVSVKDGEPSFLFFHVEGERDKSWDGIINEDDPYARETDPEVTEWENTHNLVTAKNGNGTGVIPTEAVDKDDVNATAAQEDEISITKLDDNAADQTLGDNVVVDITGDLINRHDETAADTEVTAPDSDEDNDAGLYEKDQAYDPEKEAMEAEEAKKAERHEQFAKRMRMIVPAGIIALLLFIFGLWNVKKQKN